MTNNQNPAFDVLAELNVHYSKTEDPETAKKIISLVEKELYFDLNTTYSFVPEKGFLESVFGVKVGKKSTDRLNMHDPFRYYRILAKERNERRDAHYAEHLRSRFGVDATLKGDDWVRAVEADQDAREIYLNFFSTLPIFARNLSIAKQNIDRLITNDSICIDRSAYEDLNNIDWAMDGLMTSVRNLILFSGDEYKRFEDSSYVDFFLSVDKQGDEDQKKRFHAMTKLVSDDTMQVLRAIADERNRQITAEGYTTEHDDEHTDGSIANAAAHYICADDNINLWTWDKNFDKKEKHTRDKQLLIGSALTVAEMERRIRVEKMVDITKKNSTDVSSHFGEKEGNLFENNVAADQSFSLPQHGTETVAESTKKLNSATFKKTDSGTNMLLDFDTMMSNSKEIEEIFKIPSVAAMHNALMLMAINSKTRRGDVTLNWSMVEIDEIIRLIEDEVVGYFDDKDKFLPIIEIIKADTGIPGFYFDAQLNDMLQWQNGH